MKQLLVIDCQNDFIDGSLACIYAPQAISYIVDFIEKHPEVDVFYSLDWHQRTNHSFKEFGGIWPVHCVENEEGSELHELFDTLNEKQRPKVDNKFYKGQDDVVEEYSAFNAKSELGERLVDQINDSLMVCGIASEYCVKETVRELLAIGKKIVLLAEGLGYVDEKTHQLAMAEYREWGVELI